MVVPTFFWWCLQSIQSQNPDSSWLFSGSICWKSHWSLLSIAWLKFTSCSHTNDTSPQHISLQAQTTFEWDRFAGWPRTFLRRGFMSPFQGPLGLMDWQTMAGAFKKTTDLYTFVFLCRDPKMWVERIWTWDFFKEMGFVWRILVFFFAIFFKKCSKSTVSFSHTSKYLWWYVKVPWEFWWKKVQSYLTDSKPWVNFMLDWAEQPSNVIEYNQIIKKIHT